MFFSKAVIGRNDWWLYLLGFVAVFLGYTVGQIPFMMVLMSAVNNNDDLDMSDLMAFQNNPDFAPFGISPNYGFFLLLLMFVAAAITMYLVVRYLHNKPFKSILTARSSLDWKRVFFGFGLWFGMTLLIEAVNYSYNAEAYEYTFNAAQFLPLLALALFLLPIQTSFEEFLFRGYLMQGIGLYSSHKWIPLVVTSIMFGLIHGMNPEVQEFGFGTMQVYYISAGLLLGLITVMDEGMELALGVHAATNMYGALMVGYNGAAIQTETVFRTSDLNPQLMTAIFFVSAIFFCLICAKKYNWKSFTKVLDPINLNKEEQDYV